MPKVTGKTKTQSSKELPPQYGQGGLRAKADDKSASNGNGKANGKAKAKPKEETKKKEIIYPRIEVRVFCRNPKKCPEGQKPQGLNAAIAKEILGWQDEDDYEAEMKKKYSAAELKDKPLKFQDDYLLIDRYGRKVRCAHNDNNRPFDPRTAEDYMIEILRGKWKLNGESMVVDECGDCQDLQHRLIGQVWAGQEWQKDNILPEPEQQWGQFWKTEPEMDCIIVLGIDSDDDTINSQNTGRPRTFADALYRHKTYRDSPREERARLSKITSGAVSFVWRRSEAALSSLAPRRPHSESFEFLESHPKIIECVKFILAEGDGKKLSPFISLGYAAGLLYLMGSATSVVEKYADSGCVESALDWKLWDKAQEFFVLFCTNSPAMEPLHEELNRLPVELVSVNFQVALFIKAWNLWSNKKKLTGEVLELIIDNTSGVAELGESPRIGGIDIDHEDEPETVEQDTEPPPAEGESPDDLAKRGICPKLSDKNKKPTPHEWTTDDGETFCAHCYEPAEKKLASKKKKK